MGAAHSFYSYGRTHFTRHGYAAAERQDATSSLSGSIIVVTGANSGIGYQLAQNLFSRGAKVYMICRSKERGNKARLEILTKNPSSPPENLQILEADVGRRADVERASAELESLEAKLDCLVCNAGAMADKLEAPEGVESTFASHFLYGNYWLGQKMMPLLKKSAHPKILTVTSGGMYCYPLPTFAESVRGTETTNSSFDGQGAYAKAKRAQVVLTRRWAAMFPDVTVCTVHPGWTATPGVSKAYNSFSQWWLQPLRSEWEGTEGLAWMCGAGPGKLKSGELYLDGRVQPEYLHDSTKRDKAFEETFFQELEAFVKKTPA